MHPPSPAPNDTPQSTPQCLVHGQPASGPCARCGTFLCARCPLVDGLCESCVQRLGGPDGLTVESIARHSKPNILVRRAVATWLDLLPSGGLMWAMDRLLRTSGLDIPQWTGWFWFLGYYLVCEALWGCSFGKWLLGIRIVDARGHVPGWTKAARRTLARFFEANLLLCGGLPAMATARSSPSRQRLGDRWAGTYVIMADDLRKHSRRLGQTGPG